MTANAHNGDIAMQEYMMLHTQHQELQQQLHDLCPTAHVSSPSVSPTRSNSSLSHGGYAPTMAMPSARNHRRSSAVSPSLSALSSTTLEPVPEDEDLIQVEVARGQAKLSQLNEDIKRALTELLNSDTVRSDREMRTWVQTRLMDTERELRSGRRRRSGPSMSPPA